MENHIRHWVRALVAISMMVALALPASADSKEMIESNAQRALHWLYGTSSETSDMLRDAAGVLVFGDVIKMGFGLGGEFGEGALIVDGNFVDYYAIAGKQYNAPASAAFKAEAVVFRTPAALKAFQDSASWKIGRHAQVPLLQTVKTRGRVMKSASPIVGLVFTDAGLLSGATLDGNKVSRIAR